MSNTVLLFEGEKKLKGQLQKALPNTKLVRGHTGQKLLVQIESEQPDVVIMDTAMPASDGYAVTRQLQTHRQTRHIPLIFITAKHTSADEHTEGVFALDDLDQLRDYLAHARVQARVMQQILRRTAGAGGMTDEQRSILRRGGFHGAEVDPGPLMKTEHAHGELLSTALTVAQAARRLRVTEGRVRQRLTARPPELYGLHQGNQWLLPAFQFTRGGLVPGIGQVVAALPTTLHPVAVSHWLSADNPELEISGKLVSPLGWLSAGGSPQRVVELAENL